MKKIIIRYDEELDLLEVRNNIFSILWYYFYKKDKIIDWNSINVLNYLREQRNWNVNLYIKKKI